MKGTTVRLNQWENETIKQITKKENDKRRRQGQKDVKQSEMLHSILEKELPRYLLNAEADEGETKQILML